MPKLVANARDIQAEIQRRIRKEAARTGRCGNCLAPLPIPIERRGDGVNWAVEYFPHQPGCAVFLMGILRDVMRAYDLDLRAPAVVCISGLVDPEARTGITQNLRDRPVSQRGVNLR
jgi:hypothetical protein